MRVNTVIRFALAAVLFVPIILVPKISIAIDTSHYEYRSCICGDEAGYVFFDVTEDVYDKSHHSFRDLRIITDNGKETPYKTWSRSERCTREKVEAEILNKSYIPQSYTTFTLDLGNKYIKTNRIKMTTDSVDFIRRVTVEGSTDNRIFLVLREGAFIFDFSNDHEVESLEVSYPVCDYRYLRVTIWDNGDEPLANVGGEVYIIEDVPGEYRTLAHDMEGPNQNGEKKTSEIKLDLTYKNIPSSRIVLGIKETNFKRKVLILWSNVDEDEEYREAGAGFIYNITMPDYSGEDTVVSYPEVRSRYLKIIIEDKDDPPLHISNIDVLGILKKITFRAESNERYCLYFGNPKAKDPSYDIEELFYYLDPESLVPWHLEEVTENPNYIPPKDETPFTEKYPWIIWGAIILMILVLGTIILRMMIRTSK
jgi:hypothetical protein